MNFTKNLLKIKNKGREFPEYSGSSPQQKAAQRSCFFCFPKLEFVIMDYTVYILQSENDNSFYIGYTSNLTQRIEYHNSGKSRYTSKKMPWKNIYTKNDENKGLQSFDSKSFINRSFKTFYFRSLFKTTSSPSAK